MATTVGGIRRGGGGKTLLRGNKQLGGGGPGAGMGGFPGGNPTYNQAAPSPLLDDIRRRYQAEGAGGDPLLDEHVAKLRERMSADTSKRAADFASSQINENLIGARSRLKGDLEARGLTDTGVASSSTRKLEEGAQRDKARAAAEIALGREARLDELTMGAGGIYGAPGARRERLLAGEAGAARDVVGQQNAQQQLAQQAWQQAQAQQQAMLQLFQNMWT